MTLRPVPVHDNLHFSDRIFRVFLKVLYNYCINIVRSAQMRAANTMTLAKYWLCDSAAIVAQGAEG